MAPTHNPTSLRYRPSPAIAAPAVLLLLTLGSSTTWPVLVATETPQSAEWMNCFAVVAGKACTADGSVIFAHNEDSGSDRIVNHWKIPALEHQDIESQRLVGGGSVSFAAQTAGSIWVQMPGLQYSDTYLNEWGVAVASNGCQSKEDKPELVDGGIGLMLRRIVAARATSARHGVEVATSLVAEWGYNATGRCMTIADGKEAWLLNLVRGKHWAAARVPDDMCAAIANHYTIHSVDPADNKNFHLSPGLIEYATKRGWYDPARDGRFDFATVYGADGARRHGSNIRRAWRGNHLIGANGPKQQWLQPTFIKPKHHKLRVADLMAVLRDHYEGTEFDRTDGYAKGSPYGKNGATICAGRTSYSTVFQLRGELPPAIGAVMWMAQCRPDATVYVPWYAGMTTVPSGMSHGAASAALSRHFDQDYIKHPQTLVMAAVRQFEKNLDSCYGDFFPRILATRVVFEDQLFRLQGAVESTARQLYAQDAAAARAYLTAYSLGHQVRADQRIDTLAGEMRSAHRLGGR